ncbi:MAG: glutathione S-transferase family protein [Gammaproteobacteria bacterium]
MGMLVEGKWQDVWYDTTKTGGAFKREQSQFRQWIKADGSTPFAPEMDRYHLYVSLACPWASRTLIMRKLKQLENIIGLSIVDPLMREHGWVFSKNTDCIPDTVNHCEYAYQLYTLANSHYTGRVTVPILWDKHTKTIVNNESSEIMRIFNQEFNHLTHNTLDMYPPELRPEIDKINDDIYHTINNGVYKCGFATEQPVYEQAYDELFAALDHYEQHLSQHRYLVGKQITEADWRLFVTLIRFDAVYVGHFKCNKKRIADYPNLHNYIRELYQYPGVADTVNFEHIKQHYYRSHITINPTQIVPKGPELTFNAAHDRARLTL